ncbi:MAG: hypothetical protein LBN38_07265 [Verrucomicrobiota bacterium]|nr:hypothetical protein [Verrucomicrobiota bacterium]
MMKKIGLGICVALLGAGAAFGGLLNDEPGELTLSGRGWIPGDGDFDLFEDGYGVSLSYREWFHFPWAVGVSVGVAHWEVDDGSDAYKYPMLTGYEGDALLIPLGVSLYFSMIDWDNWNLNLKTGVEYLFVDSNVSVFNNEENVKARQDVDIGNAILWNVGAEYEYMIAENAYIAGELGYQVDVMRADTDYAGRSARDTSFRGFYLGIGVKFLF